MMIFLVLLPILFVGFGVGYAVRAWRSHKRRERYRLHAAYLRPISRVTERPIEMPKRRAF